MASLKRYAHCGSFSRVSLLHAKRIGATVSPDPDRQIAGAAYRALRPSGGLRTIKAERRNALQPLLQRHHHFHPRQVRADAAMNAEPESGMRIVLAIDQDLVGVG